LRQNINQLVEKGGFQLSDAVLMHSKRISSGQKKVKIIPIIISKRLFSGRLVLLFVVDVACGRKMSHFDGILISVDGRFCGTRTQEGGWVGLAPGKGLGGWFRCSRGCHDSGPGPRLLHLDVGLSIAAAGLVVVPRVRVAALALQAALRRGS